MTASVVRSSKDEPSQIPSLNFRHPVRRWTIPRDGQAEFQESDSGSIYALLQSGRVEQSEVQSLDAASVMEMPMTILLMPLAGEALLEDVEEVREWLRGLPVDTPTHQPQWLSLQHVQMVWHPRCLALWVDPQREEKVLAALWSCHQLECGLTQLEAEVESGWGSADEDTPLAFEFNSDAIPRRSQLATRFQRVVRWRARHARFVSKVVVPHVFPPTIASQLGERFRERFRMEDRVEHLQVKLEAQSHVYELCSQRSSEYMVARTGHILEWVIIILLAAQTLFWLVDLMTATTTP